MQELFDKLSLVESLGVKTIMCILNFNLNLTRQGRLRVQVSQLATERKTNGPNVGPSFKAGRAISRLSYLPPAVLLQ